MVETSPNTTETKNNYVPGSSEKKRAIMLYLLFWLGIVFVVNRKKLSIFEYYHLRQSTGWWLWFIVVLVISIILLFVPLLKYIAILAIISFVGLLWAFTKQAWDGKYKVWFDNTPLGFFPALGGWIVDLFELEITVD